MQHMPTDQLTMWLTKLPRQPGRGFTTRYNTKYVLSTGSHNKVQLSAFMTPSLLSLLSSLAPQIPSLLPPLTLPPTPPNPIYVHTYMSIVLQLSMHTSVSNILSCDISHYVGSTMFVSY